jgi:hypothetical protein
MSLKKFVLSALLISMLSIPGMPSYVRANGSPVNPAGKGNLYFDSNSSIKLTNEDVIFKYNKKPLLRGNALVEVTYHLKNMTDDEKSINIYVLTPPVPGINTRGSYVKASVDGKEPLNIKPYAGITRGSLSMSKMLSLKDPVSGDVIKSALLDQDSVTYGSVTSLIPLQFKPNEDKNLKVEYSDWSGVYRGKDVLNRVYSHLFFLSPAGLYDGSPNVHLKVVFPKGTDYALSSNIPVKRVENSVYEANLNSIPQNEWLFSFVDRNNLVLGTNSRVPYISFVTIALILLSGLFYYIQAVTKREWITAAAYPALFLGFVFLTMGMYRDTAELVILLAAYIAIALILYRVYSRAKLARV